ncbi:ATP/maltotriose-dependent transcriptional regulator MalT [Rhizobium sp. BK275]|nr:ATP/maltotriose-dependent transcriptional regulator MalT [Rhizobium sp. BK275]
MIDGFGAVGLVHAIALVAGDIAGDPVVRTVEAGDDLVGRGGNLPQLLRCELDCKGRWQEAADIWTDRRAPYFAALPLLDGDNDALYRALTTLEALGALGATAVTAHVKDMIRKRSGRLATRGPRASTKANAASLTTRELDVLRLIDEGRSNAEIGARLFVPAKTVDHHISSILAKLNAKSRGQAAAEGRRLGLLQ